MISRSRGDDGVIQGTVHKERMTSSVPAFVFAQENNGMGQSGFDFYVSHCKSVYDLRHDSNARHSSLLCKACGLPQDHMLYSLRREKKSGHEENLTDNNF